jgi:hypothetical protein
MIHQPKPKSPGRRWLDRILGMARFRTRTFLGALAWPLLFPAAWLWRRTGLRGTRLIAVTGSLGKTSTTVAAAAVLGAAANPDARNFGSFLALALLRHRPRHQPLVVEVGISRRGQMERYARLLRPDMAAPWAGSQGSPPRRPSWPTLSAPAGCWWSTGTMRAAGRSPPAATRGP